MSLSSDTAPISEFSDFSSTAATEPHHASSSVTNNDKSVEVLYKGERERFVKVTSEGVGHEQLG